MKTQSQQTLNFTQAAYCLLFLVQLGKNQHTCSRTAAMPLAGISSGSATPIEPIPATSFPYDNLWKNNARLNCSLGILYQHESITHISY